MGTSDGNTISTSTYLVCSFLCLFSHRELLQQKLKSVKKVRGLQGFLAGSSSWNVFTVLPLVNRMSLEVKIRSCIFTHTHWPSSGNYLKNQWNRGWIWFLKAIARSPCSGIHLSISRNEQTSLANLEDLKKPHRRPKLNFFFFSAPHIKSNSNESRGTKNIRGIQ